MSADESGKKIPLTLSSPSAPLTPLKFSGSKIGSFFESANSFTGDGVKICLRPTGRSGWVITAWISKSDSLIKASRKGTARSGVPRKTIFVGIYWLSYKGFWVIVFHLVLLD